MRSVACSVLGAALLLTGASAAMAASGTAPAGAQSVQTGASTTTTAANSAPVADQPQKSQQPKVADKADTYGGNDPNSLAGARAFWQALNPY